jgi:uncharacterized protein YqeY
MNLLEQINEDIKTAMRAKNKIALEAIRAVKKEFIEAQTAKGSDGTLSDSAALKIIQKLIKQRKDSAELYISQERKDLADAELQEVEVLEKYLPEQMTPEEIEAAIKSIIADTGAEGMKDMGKVMGIASKQLAGKAEGTEISLKVKALLA